MNSSSKSYEVYKTSVGGVAMNGDKMKDFIELPEKIKNAWSSIDNFYDDILRKFHKSVLDACFSNFAILKNAVSE